MDASRADEQALLDPDLTRQLIACIELLSYF